MDSVMGQGTGMQWLLLLLFKAAATSGGSMEPKSPAVALLLEWLQYHGGYVSESIAVQTTMRDSRGLAVRSYIPAGHTVMWVPDQLVLRSDHVPTVVAAVAQLELPPELGRYSDNARGAIATAAILVQQRQSQDVLTRTVHAGQCKADHGDACKESFFEPYVDSLPSECPSNAAAFDETHLALLDAGSSAPTVSIARVAHWALPHVLKQAGFPRISAARQRWAICMAVARSFPERESAFGQSLIPVIDLANHGDSAQVKRARKDGKDGWELMVVRRLWPGDEVTLWYGDWTNSQFLAGWGFQVSGNPVAFGMDFQIEDDMIAASAPLVLEKIGCKPVMPPLEQIIFPPELHEEEVLKLLRCLRAFLYGPAAERAVATGYLDSGIEALGDSHQPLLQKWQTVDMDLLSALHGFCRAAASNIDAKLPIAPSIGGSNALRLLLWGTMDRERLALRTCAKVTAAVHERIAVDLPRSGTKASTSSSFVGGR